MKNFFVPLLMLVMCSPVGMSCSVNDPDRLPVINQPSQPGLPDQSEGNQDNDTIENQMSNKIRITVGSTSFTATLENNATVEAFKRLLPMTVVMNEMNRNEKYYYLPEDLPTASSNHGTVHSGDLMLYGSSCLVLFYTTFSTLYSYTRLGRLDNSVNLHSVLGTGNVTVMIELQ